MKYQIYLGEPMYL